MIQTNKLTELLKVKELYTVSATTYGEPIESYKTVATIYATITNQRGNISFNSLPGNVYSDSISFYMRYFPACKKGTRIEYNCQDYEVINFTHVQRNQATIIECIGIK
ncbi:head-tail adaptor protein [Ohtaekwangia koreensis]|uniref:Phage head-tail joining protein n=1 Tax=Ohtaekwangia koreensis TaxID=688867 RepID=A0A1T5JQA6_9BACT|nr:head-tail adaptor protein [Ohtaekwangia koreensis]SKC53509.1 Phage head-tail joining protein [Ohtaekwangia koreensis]